MNWRDVYEDKDSTGCEVIDVLMHEGRGVAFVYKSDSGINYVHHSGAQLIEKPKPKKYRPFTRSEIKCGDVFRHKSNGVDYMIAVVGDCYVKFANGDGAIDTAVILEKYTKPDGSPAGMLED